MTFVYTYGATKQKKEKKFGQFTNYYYLCARKLIIKS